MVIVRRFLDWLRRPAARIDVGGSDQVAFVRSYEVPMLQQELLLRNGIRCEILDGRNHATWEPMAAIMVSTQYRCRALEVIDTFKQS